ncbi:toxin-antitoxin system YwqK family antitoxin [Hyunsoonleella sp. 2307UL5-6]
MRYYNFNLRMKKLVVFSVLIFVTQYIVAQKINQYDANGKRHGIWTKSFKETDVMRYQGSFHHGKEIGLFKFYKNVKGVAVLSATRQFNDSTDVAEVKFFTSKGKLISEGNMRGKLYIGSWKFYQKKSDKLLISEFYNDEGQLDGKRFVYYNNGEITEETTYREGVLHGNATYYSLKGVLLKTLIYENGALHGEAKFYNPKGSLLAEGVYRKGKKHGIWKYYENDTLKETKDYTIKGKYNPKKKAP